MSYPKLVLISIVGLFLLTMCESVGVLDFTPDSNQPMTAETLTNYIETSQSCPESYDVLNSDGVNGLSEQEFLGQDPSFTVDENGDPLFPIIDSTHGNGDGVIDRNEYEFYIAFYFPQCADDGSGDGDDGDGDGEEDCPPTLEELDVNGDGLLSQNEFEAQDSEFTEDENGNPWFPSIDQNSNDQLDSNEYTNFVQSIYPQCFD